MSTLKEKADEILAEKEEKIIPENIRYGIEIFGVMGEYGATNPILYVTSKEDLDNISASLGDLAVLQHTLGLNELEYSSSVKAFQFVSAKSFDISVFLDLLNGQDRYDNGVRWGVALSDEFCIVMDLSIEKTLETDEEIGDSWYNLDVNINFNLLNSEGEGTFLVTYNGIAEIRSGASITLNCSGNTSRPVVVTSNGHSGITFSSGEQNWNELENLITNIVYSATDYMSNTEVYTYNGWSWCQIL